MAPDQPLSIETLLTRRFGVAWVFLLVSAALGLLLRVMAVRPIDPLVFGHVLHAHSHVAFLGWVFNAFFVAALRHFVPPKQVREYGRVWWTMQIAVLGMLATFPAQGYATASITFSTLHMGVSAVFAWKLWHHSRAASSARLYLRTALLCMLVSGLGPIALGPLAALDLHQSPAYPLAIYFYLHFQLNGWFVLFLLALWMQRRSEQNVPVSPKSARRAAPWLIGGRVMTFALSTLWLNPPAWVQVTAVLGATLQLVGVAHLLRGARRTCPAAKVRSVSTFLWRFAIGALLLKFSLQFLGGLPGLDDLASQRFVVVAFLHLVFLGFVTPALITWAVDNDWLRSGRVRSVGIGLYLAGTVVTEVILVLPSVFSLGGWAIALPIREVLLGAAIVLTVGIAALGASVKSSNVTPHAR